MAVNQVGEYANSPFYDFWQSWSAACEVAWTPQAGANHVARLADQRLRTLLKWTRTHSRFYQDLYRGLELEDCPLTDLPIVTKRELIAHFDEVITDPDVTMARVRAFLAQEELIGQPFLNRYSVWTSSGSTGEPGVFLHDGRSLAVYDALETLRFRRLNWATAVAASFGNERYALVGATGGHFAGIASTQRLRLLYPWLAGRLQFFSVLDAAERLDQALNEYQPALLATYPSAAGLLAEEQLCGRLAIHPNEIWTGGEQLFNGQRQLIARAFNCKIRDEYGASEFLPIAAQCEAGALHVNADWVTLEPIDERYRPVPAGTPSHSVLLTNLVNRVQPLIRYDLGDSVTWREGPCECGSPLPLVRVEGRCDDILTLRAANGAVVKLLPLALTTVLEEGAGISQFRLLQVGPDALVLELDPREANTDIVSRCRAVLARFLNTQCLPNIRLDVQVAMLLPHPVSGKRRRIVMATKK